MNFLEPENTTGLKNSIEIFNSRFVQTDEKSTSEETEQLKLIRRAKRMKKACGTGGMTSRESDVCTWESQKDRKGERRQKAYLGTKNFSNLIWKSNFIKLISTKKFQSKTNFSKIR